MRTIYKHVSVIFLALALTVLVLPPAQAHLMAGQHGTLNIVDDGAFMVLSLPMSAFKGVDDDNDGHVSMIEFNNHRAAIVDSVRQNATLSGIAGNLPLEGIMLSPVVSHGSPEEPISQLTVMGRYSLSGLNSALRFQVDLFGTQSDEQLMEITATRNAKNQKYAFELTPVTPASPIFSE